MKKITIFTVCNICKERKTIENVPSVAYWEWRAGGGNIQTLLPTLTPGERELLISGTCETCFDKMFPKTES